MTKRIIALLILLSVSAALAGFPRSSLERLVRVRRAEPFPTDGLVAYWSMDSRSTNTVFDTKGDNDGTAVNAPDFGTAYGKYKEGVNLNGSSQYIVMSYDESANPDEITIAGWVKLTSIASRSTIISSGDGNAFTSNNYILEASSAGMRLRLYDRVSRSDSNADVLSINTWHHVAVTIAISVLSFYVDGVAAGTNSVTYTPDNVDLGVAIGAVNRALPSSFFNGQIDEVAIWNRALSSNEVSEIYNNGAGRFYTP